MKVGTRSSIGAVLAAGCLMFGSGYAAAQEITLKAVNAFQEGTYFARNFESFVKKVNAEGKGLVQIQYLGGPKAMPAAEHGTALRRGVVDLANSTASYTANLVPEGMALSFSPLRMEVLRRNGALDYLNKLYLEKDLYYLGRTAEGISYHVFTNKRIERVDLTGQKLRVAAIYRDFFQTLGATVVQTAAGEVYTALERGVVDGFGWPLIGIFDLGWQEKTKYRVDPGFYSVDVSLFMNLDAWKRLTPQQREYLNRQVLALEAQNDYWKSDNEAEAKRQAQAGIETITFQGEMAKQYVDKAYEVGWASILKASPEYGARMKAALTK